MRSKGGTLRALVVIAVVGAPGLLATTAHAAGTPISIPEVTTPPVSTPVVTVPSVDVTVPVTVTVPEMTIPTVTVPLPVPVPTTLPEVQDTLRPATVPSVPPPTTAPTAPAAPTSPPPPAASRDRSAAEVPRSGTENGKGGVGAPVPTAAPVVEEVPTLAAAARHATAPFAVPIGAMLLIAAYVVLRGAIDRRDLRLASASSEDPWVGFR